MKIPGIAFLLLLPVLAYAEKPATTGDESMSEQNMQRMSERMQEMQKCLNSINKADLKKVEKRSIEFEKKIRSLCATGKRDQAQKEALSYGKKISTMPAMQSMKKCAEKIQGLMQDMPMPGQDMDFSNRHACDELSGTD